MQVSTKDGHLICRHGPTLDDSTDVLQHPDFAKRRRSQVSSRHVWLPLLLVTGRTASGAGGSMFAEPPPCCI